MRTIKAYTRASASEIVRASIKAEEDKEIQSLKKQVKEAEKAYMELEENRIDILRHFDSWD